MCTCIYLGYTGTFRIYGPHEEQVLLHRLTIQQSQPKQNFHEQLLKH